MTSAEGTPAGQAGEGSETGAILSEVEKTRDTADRMARDGVPEGADATSVLAGLISQLAEQVERLARSADATGSLSPGGASLSRDRALEEDVSPEESPAAPRRDPDASD